MLRLFAALALTAILSGCFQTEITTRIKKDGSSHGHFQTTTNILFAPEIEKSIKKQGNVVQTKTLSDGRVRLEWAGPWRSQNYQCKGIFFKECTYSANFPFNIPDPSIRLMIEAGKKNGDQSMAMKITHVVVLPKDSKVTFTDAHNSYVDGEGINLEWVFTPSHGDFISMKFTVSL